MTHPTSSIERTAVGPIDTSAIRDSFIGDDELLADLIKAFRGHAPKLLHEIQTGLETGDAALVQRAAHTLKGSLGIFGMTAAYEAALALEAASRGGAIDRAAAAFAQVKSMYVRLNAAFDQILESLESRL
jgi:HPt (histidine-containing phosphotransfer) domain-containing protein